MIKCIGSKQYFVEARFFCPIRNYGLRKTKTVKNVTLKQAQKIEKAMLLELQESSLKYEKQEPKPQKSITFSEAIDLYLENLRVRGKDSKNYVDSVLRVKRIFGNVGINQVPKALSELHKSLLSKKVSGATINHYTNIVRAVMSLMVKMKIIKDNPITSISFPKYPEHPRERILTDIEEKKLLETVKTFRPQIFRLIQFMLQVPCRWKSELLYAKTHQYLKDKQMIFISAQDSKAKIPIYKPIPPDMIEYFDNIPDTQNFLFFDKETNDFQVWRAFKFCCKRAGIEKEFCIHSLRHCAITKLVSNGQNSNWDLCSITGWKTPNQLKTYYHLDRFLGAERIKF
jgi:integrase